MARVKLRYITGYPRLKRSYQEKGPFYRDIKSIEL